MIYNLEKIDVVINKIIRDLGLGSEEIPWQDFIEWIAEGLLHIGAYNQLQQKEDLVIINDFKGTLPCDLYKVIRILKGMSVTKGDGSLYSGSFNNLIYNLEIELSSLPGATQIEVLQGQGLRTPIGKPEMYGQINTLLLNHNGNLIGDPRVNSFTNNDYNINFNNITVGFQQGFLQLQYLALPVDERGYPLVPDDVSFRDAMFWKVAYHLCIRNPDIFKNKSLQNLDYVRDKWLTYCSQARAGAYMPDMDGIQRLANNWLRLYNVPDFDNQLYNGIGKKQNLNLDRRL